MNVVLFRPLTGEPDVLVATLSGFEKSAAAIVTRTPGEDPSWPPTWSYRIAGDVQYGPSDPFGSEREALDHAAARLCAVLHQDPLDWVLDRENETIRSSFDGTSPSDPVVRVAGGGSSASGSKTFIRFWSDETDVSPNEAYKIGQSIIDHADAQTRVVRPDPTRVTRTGVVGRSLLSRLRGVWKAWRL